MLALLELTLHAEIGSGDLKNGVNTTMRRFEECLDLTFHAISFL